MAKILNTEDAGDNFRSVRLIGFAAEPMDAATLKRLRERISPNIVQVYGSTEIGAAATCIGADEMLGDRLVSVGRPLVNSEVRVVTPGGTPGESVPDGEVGEVLVSSPSLAAEIWGDPEATAAAFVIDGERRWWRSRDLGRFDNGGYLYLEGRRDDMIISGGINIMPARVEDVLLAHPGVAECAVVGAKCGMGRRGAGFHCRPRSEARCRGDRAPRSLKRAFVLPAAARLSFRARFAAHLDRQSAAANAARDSD